jgi:hypothetical protein
VDLLLVAVVRGSLIGLILKSEVVSYQFLDSTDS